MNRPLTLVDSYSPDCLGVGLKERLTGIGKSLTYYVARASTFKKVLGSTVLTAVALGVAGILEGPRTAAYVSVFVGSIVTNAILFLPSGRGAILIGGALLLNPWAVAVSTGVGGAIGELSGYVLGRASHKVLKHGKLPAWLSRHAERRMGLTVLLVSAVPSPFVDVIGIVAGRVGYPVGRYLAFTTAGKVAQSLVMVSILLWNVSLISRWIGLG